ncbi:uncharacterized protein MCAP_0864-like [Mytilus edulis]|uniref:uncharacterized protein MCAP_0864-like n=1 Tax=Mytilus edulis TaxID=6550 RepID=UPI0039F02521
MAEVENENATSAELFYRKTNEYKHQLNYTLIQSQKENITSQRAITNLKNNIRKLSEELKESKKSVIKKEADKITSQRAVKKLQSNLRIVSEDLKKSVTNSESEKIVSQRTITKLQTYIRNLFEELNDLKTRFLSMTDKLQEAEQKTIELTKSIDDQNQDKETASAKLKNLENENEYLVHQLRSNETKIKLLHTSHETERNKHKSAMKRMHARCAENEIELEKLKNAHFDLLLQIERVHNYSRISMEETALFDKTFIEQKLEDERTKEEDLAEVTTNIIKKFASAKERHGVIKSFQKRIEKSSCPCPFGNDVLSDEDSHMERFPTAIHEHRDNKQYNERLEESKTTKNCHNKTEKNTNVFNISMNIAKSNVSFIDKKEERTLCLNGGSSDHKAIEGKEQL